MPDCPLPAFALRSLKRPDHYVERSTLEYLCGLFNSEAFVETGTCHGDTTLLASSIFDRVYTSELSVDLFLKAHLKLRGHASVSCYWGDSPSCLNAMLPQIRRKKILFWLDAHYSGDGTAKSDAYTPIVQELEEIARAGIRDAVILIDDLREFRGWNWRGRDPKTNYPNAVELKHEIQKINPAYRFYLYGDASIAFLDPSIRVSPAIECSTASLLFDYGEGSLRATVDAEAVLATLPPGEERDCLASLKDTYHVTVQTIQAAGHYAYWAGLILQAQDRWEEAAIQFVQAIQSECTHWRVWWHLHRAAERIGRREWMELARQKFAAASLPAEDLSHMELRFPKIA